MEDKLDILILAGGDIRNKFSYVKNNCSCPALIPLNTKPIVNYTLEFYYRHKSAINHIYLVINEVEKNVVSKELSAFLEQENVSLLCLGDTIGVIDTLNKALDVAKPTSEVIINLVTTVPTQFPELNEVQLSKLRSGNDEWSVISYKEKLNVHPKGKGIDKVGHAFTGLFRTQANSLSQALESNLNQDLVEIIEPLARHSSLQFHEVEWIDCGHEINFVEAKKRLINSRAFNSIRVEGNGILVKSSENADKLRQEVAYVSNLPMELSLYFPRILKSYDCEETHVVEMEFFPFPNIAELALYWELSDKVWEKIFTRMERTLQSFKSHKGEISRESYQKMYIDKTLDRILEFKAAQQNSSLFENQIEINGQGFKGINHFEQRLKDYFTSSYDEVEFNIMHGDFCFNNILYNIPSDSLKLIDARGSFGNGTSIYGDIYYDLAKLTHSSIFGYDYIVNDLFEIKEIDNKYELKLNWRENRGLLEKNTLDLIDNLGLDKKRVFLITALLFLSMTPLHSDSKRRQTAMYLTGIRVLNETLSE